jgi:predicted metal-dependent phosphoesterase TrpH
VEVWNGEYKRFVTWLLCDFHIHTTFSDGSIPLEEVVDLYGQKGFDAISITDHILDSQSKLRLKSTTKKKHTIEKSQFKTYLHKVWQEAQRAWERYRMLVIPGMEITNNTKKYHILGIDVKEYIDPDLSVEEIVEKIHQQGGIAIACHPIRKDEDNMQRSIHLWKNHIKYALLFDAWEVANRDDLFNVIGLKKFNYIANSDFHDLRHLYSWKTLLSCEKNTEAIKSTIRNNFGVAIYLYRKNNDLVAV